MNRLFPALVAASLLLTATFPVGGEEGKQKYEAENARLSGHNSVISDASASGGKAVGRFESADDALEFTISVSESGAYDLIFTARGIGGGKINNVLVDGEYQGQIETALTTYSDAPLRGVHLTQGEHTVKVTVSWGWIALDSLTVVPAQGIPDSVYEVSSTLINPQADAAAQALYRLLLDTYGHYTLAGQVCDGGITGAEFQALYSVTGAYPAILGLDMMDYTPARVSQGAHSQAVERAIEFHRLGGIVTFCWHWSCPLEYIREGRDANGNPRWWGAFYSENTTFNLAKAILTGEDPQGMAQLDRDIQAIAAQLNVLRDAGVPVLWRPLHEAAGGWFWWGAQGPEAYKALWIHLYRLLTQTYGCTNLIWVWNGQNPDWYPGDEYVDIIGEDIYAEKHSYSPQNSKFAELLTYSQQNKIIALTENGVVFDIERAVQTNARWAWFCTWCGEFVQENQRYSEAYTEEALLRKVYDSEYVLTLEKLNARRAAQ